MLNTILQAILQGLTEFLPVSSSGHLSLFQHFTGQSGEGALLLSAILHLGTLVAIFIAFWGTVKDLIFEFGRSCRDIVHKKFFENMNPNRRALVMLILSTLILVPFVFVKDFFESFAEDDSILAEGVFFLYTCAILYWSDKKTNGKKDLGHVNGKDAAVVGLFQVVALLPGVSRSGSTIAGGLFRGFKRDTAVKYAFLMGIPAILGGCLVEVKDAVSSDMTFSATYIVGFFVAMIVGILAIKMVNWLVTSNKFRYFAYYTGALGAVVIVIAIIEKIMGHAITF